MFLYFFSELFILNLQESLYFISRVQEATVQQERFINNAALAVQKNENQSNDNQQQSSNALRSKLKLTLKLVDKNYKLLNQITYCSQLLPEEKLIEASEAGYQAVEELQSAIDYVNNDNNWRYTNDTDNDEMSRYDVLITALQNCRQELFVFLQYIEPKEKLTNARIRVENENKDNRDEFDGDSNAGVYNPVILPWK